MLPRRITLKSGEWVDAQDLQAGNKNIWFRMLILKDLDGDLQEVQSDGWCFVKVVLTQLRIKCWVKQFKESES